MIMAVQSFGGDGHMHMGHLMGDVPALLLVAIVLSILILPSGRDGMMAAPHREVA